MFFISGKIVRAENGRQFLDGSATQISRRDVAKYMLDNIKETSVYKACVAVGVGMQYIAVTKKKTRESCRFIVPYYIHRIVSNLDS